MELVNIVYRYMNHFINSEELIELLTKIDKNNFSEEEIKELDKLILDVQEITNNVDNEIDKIEEERINSYDKVLDILDKIINDENNDEETRKSLSDNYKKVIYEKNRKRDCGPRYERLFDLLRNNTLYKKSYESMNDRELLNVITHYISAPIVPEIDQETFDRLADISIKEDMKETLWRLAFNYNNKNINFSKIEDYFINIRDDYYLIELICAVENDLDMDKLVDKVFETNDKDFIIRCGNRANELDLFNEEEKNKIRLRLKEII